MKSFLSSLLLLSSGVFLLRRVEALEELSEPRYLQANSSSGDIMKYSYICLSANLDLCIGISPGNLEPSYDPNNLYEIQVKNRLNNEYTGDDYKKTRWDVNYDTEQISLSRFANLCIGKPGGTPGNMYLYPCTSPQYSLLFNLTFNDNVIMEGLLQPVGTTLCATVMRCNAKTGTTYCDPNSVIPVTGGQFNNFINGAYVKLRQCYWATGANPLWEPSQTWRQRLDCAVGCSPYLQYNNVCDPACDVQECDWDNLNCQTPSPSLPTSAPTTSPTNTPTFLPTHHPTTLAPTSSKPTVSPTSFPTTKPTTHPTTKGPTPLPTRRPSQAPSSKPTKKPTSLPSARPTTLKPTRLPTEHPTTRPTHAPSRAPTRKPTRTPTVAPTRSPSPKPSRSPTDLPSASPTKFPTNLPTTNPTQSPSKAPTLLPTKLPSTQPTPNPSFSPSQTPTKPPTSTPSPTLLILENVLETPVPTHAGTKSPTTFFPQDLETWLLITLLPFLILLCLCCCAAWFLTCDCCRRGKQEEKPVKGKKAEKAKGGCCVGCCAKKPKDTPPPAMDTENPDIGLPTNVRRNNEEFHAV